MGKTMEKVIVTHPDNVQLIRDAIGSGEFDAPGQLDQMFVIRPNKHMDIDKPTGRYVLPDGEVVARDDVLVTHRFVEYGPDDIYLLLFARVIREERTPVFFSYDDSALIGFSTSFLMPRHKPCRAFFTYCMT